MSSPLPRRRFIQGTALATGAAFLPATAAHAADAVTIGADGITLTGRTDGSVLVQDGTGADRVLLPHFMIKDSVLGQQRTFGGTPTQITLPDGRPAIQVDYTMGGAAPGVAVRGVFDVTAHRAHLRWEVSGSPTLTPTGFMFARTVYGASRAESYEALTTWLRDPRGGIPYETDAGGAYVENWTGLRGFFCLPSTDPAYTNATWVHSPGTATGSGTAVTEADLVLGDLRPRSAGALAQGRPLSVDVWTDQPFNLYETAGQTMTLNAEVVNGGPAAKPVTVRWWARDFSGTEVAGGTVSRTLAAGAAWQPSFAVTAPGQGIVFTEVQAVAGDDTALARTNLSVLPPFGYRAGADSMFGIANYPWLLEPSEDAVLGLLRTLGVRWIRIAYDGAPGLPVAALDAAGIAHNVELSGIPVGGTAEQIAAWADTNVARALAAGAACFEVANEVNQPWMSGRGADAYVRDGLRQVTDRLTAAGSSMKVMNAGLGGMDHVWTENFRAAGGWDLIDAFAFHPGRGNFTPDYAPPPEEWTLGSNGTYWNFLGALRKARQIVQEYGGDKEIWLTEAYAATRPNAWWTDTYRHAAENVLLTLALAKAEGVRGVNWYQLHDSTLHHPQEADPDNPEYHYGLMNRDTSAKPSLLAYATAARVLDRATFVRHLAFADADIKGLLFTTPDGPVSILWSRKDGYLLNADHTDDPWYATPEPWIDPWPTKTDVVAHSGTVQGTVTEVDCIGRRRTLTAAGGKVTLTLDGAPRVYHGLAANPDWK
ncbi:hypothetical protein [Streptomyces shenzhenensis]|uniref:Uncharacterized protein n=1 Tax=Streptomyces shenzhenensis TaxID=943815 RepID=A0A3M0I1T5_9ACTN|nr:hypothetical protein [Streptomyces shenzhenensis]RMB82110.1 hypothetical protein CTZ28_31540 [Streptomyces shenzhenensis]